MAAEAHWFWLFTFTYAAWCILEAWVFFRDLRTASGERGDRGSVRLIVASVFTGIFLAWAAVFAVPAARIHAFHFPLFLLGVGLMWCGMGLRLWAIRTLGRFFRTTVLVQDEHRLVSDGPYRWLRHPSYTGALLIMLGVGLALGNWLSLAIMVVAFVPAYGYRIHVEEKALAQRFGDVYAAYARKRWRLLPFVC